MRARHTPTQAIIDSHLDQILTRPWGELPPSTPGYVLGSATPHGNTEWEHLHNRRDRIMARLSRDGAATEPGYAVGAVRSFVEPIAFASGLDLAITLDAARALGVPVILYRREGTVSVLDPDGAVLGHGAELRAESTGTCVMPNEEPGSVCYMHGGPYGSRAINAAADWRLERTRLLRALGCTTCEQGRYFRFRATGPDRLLSGGGPISLTPHTVTTRYTACFDPTLPR